MASKKDRTAIERSRPTTEAAAADAWTVRPVDELTGQILSPNEAAFRAVVRSDHEQQLIAVDAAYYAQRDRIHEPLRHAQGVVLDSDDWEVSRTNATALRVPLRTVVDAERLDDPESEQWGSLAVRFARALCGPRAALVMEHLYAISNEPPYWRRPRLSISIAELADRLGYTRDARGVHRDHTRKEVSRILLALHFTHVALQSTADGESRGGFSPLISKLYYSTREDVADLSPREVFERGLPDQVSLEIGWYGSIRDDDGNPMQSYVRMLVPQRTSARGRSNRSGASTIDNLRRHIGGYQATIRPGGSIWRGRSCWNRLASLTRIPPMPTNHSSAPLMHLLLRARCRATSRSLCRCVRRT